MHIIRQEMAAQLEAIKEQRRRSDDRVLGLRNGALAKVKAGKRARENGENVEEEGLRSRTLDEKSHLPCAKWPERCECLMDG